MPRFLPALVVGLVCSTAYAFGPHERATRPAAETLTAMSAAGITRPLRTYVAVDFTTRATTAWTRLAATGTWQAAWDAATGVPSRIWGSGLAAPGASADPAIAERFAREVLATHLALLAPGAAITDFVLVSNTTDGDIRSVGFVQRTGGRRVVGGQVSFRFKRDRLFVIASEALPDVQVDVPRTRLAAATLRVRATAALRTALDLPTAPVTAPGDDVVLPLVATAGVLGYRVAVPMTIDGGADGKYLAYIDPATAGVIAVEQQNLYATGTLLYKGVDRHPLRGRIDRAVRTAHVAVDGVATTTGVDGAVTAGTVTTGVVGDLVEIQNKGATTTLASAQLALAPGGQAVWDATANGEDDAQVVTYLAVNTVKDFVRTHVDAQMPGLDMPIKALVNIPKSCNAFYDGDAINFFAASMQCQNTGVIDDVIFHEFGHALHHAEIIDGVGRFDGAMSEGAADFLGSSITNDSGLGRGLFYNEEPLREIDPPADEFRWPDDIGEIHGTGRIFAGAFWDLRKALIAQYGDTAGPALAIKLYVAALRRASSIPTSFVEVLAADDDDGNLDNGTPNECAIRAAFGRHGLRSASGSVDAPATLATSDPSAPVAFRVSGLSARCPAADAIDRAILIWVPSYTRVPAAGSTQMTQTAPGVFTGSVPLPESDVVYYSAHILFADGTTLTLADNLGDRYYSLWQGETVPLYCTSFDTDPFAEGWHAATSDGSASPWAWAVPDGNPDDPPAAYTGSHVLMQAGRYAKAITTYVVMPQLDIGQWSDVHLQYRRWLAVEDSEFDKARIMVDGLQAWVNGTASRGDSSSFHTIDKEWRFHDVRVSGYVQGTKIDVAFELAADPGLQMGGWGIDDVCIVANVHSICGDGVVSPTEQCDDGPANGARPNACRSWCAKPRCGDFIVDDKEECDDGLSGSPECSMACKSLVDVGCCSASSRVPPGALVLGAIVLGFVLRRRRCRA